ncbi:ABC transporter ATP-binding protein [Candidatus Methylacidiphilum fumarolicum]|uniref:ABC-type molybdate transport system, ATPase component n=2 Tax=Candidatus Methylacidiphilum fumarolicum TaxID=591154 RepID=I0JWP0_METFB|nr:ABC transporter ATP-binding protein [Candidatus Methylacidiphilum fumarolicum]MBW6414355.1 ABC transporter ATP-binding protein [Candidatus Methylacidiphilum fumarolicum]TFE67859.1 Fe3+/spermidine/putrescine ABC transporter ATP-binding protein [Candidatus Methylacidiphilum fumarolicum]TFE73006.1 ABC transporter ATP-binding protein [Candidatus Methylacidiphilum fumarolicum]TFE75098.1 ABC transporter ATP-binding protein [Candidatus Methylacidiphilum fumarolicum]TFE76320.1 Fe3+/spermidine/putre
MEEKKSFYLKIEKDLSQDFRVEIELTLPLFPASLIAIFGPSGSGKSTLLRCIAGLDIPDHGIIKVGEELWLDTEKKINVPPYKRSIGYVVQEDALFPHLKVEDNVGYGLKNQLKLTQTEARDKARQALRKVGIEHLASRWPQTLSGGERRRVALARAIAREPKLLLLDEPLNGLDFKSKEFLRQLIEEIASENGRLTVLISHEKTEIIQMARFVGIIDHGKLLQLGELREVFMQPATVEVAKIIGIENIVPGEILDITNGNVRMKTPIGLVEAVLKENMGKIMSGKKVFCVFRAEDLSLCKPDGVSGSAGGLHGFSVRNRFIGTIKKIKINEGFAQVFIDCGMVLTALISHNALFELKIREGDSVCSLLKAGGIHLIERDF